MSGGLIIKSGKIDVIDDVHSVLTKISKYCIKEVSNRFVRPVVF